MRIKILLIILACFSMSELIKAQESPTNGRIAFVLEVDGNSEIFTVNPDGSHLKQLTFTEEREYDPAWSPDGKKIAYSRDLSLYIMDADGSNQISIPDTYGTVSIDWSPDGKMLVYVLDGDIYVLDLDTNISTNLTNTYPEVDLDPSWSPDGTRIAFVSTGDRPVISPRDGELTFDIYVMDSDGSNQEKFVVAKFGLVGVGYVDWLSDDVLIYKTSLQEPTIYSFNLVTQAKQALSESNIYASSPAISPDKKKIAYIRNGELAIMNSNGKNVVILRDFDYKARSVVWQPIPAVTNN